MLGQVGLEEWVGVWLNRGLAKLFGFLCGGLGGICSKGKTQGGMCLGKIPQPPCGVEAGK